MISPIVPILQHTEEKDETVYTISIRVKKLKEIDKEIGVSFSDMNYGEKYVNSNLIDGLISINHTMIEFQRQNGFEGLYDYHLKFSDQQSLTKFIIRFL